MAAQNKTGLNETFDLLTHPHRRYVLYYLTNDSELVDLETLAGAIADLDRGQAATGPNASAATIATGLRHTHLPKLADAGVITYDADTGSIELDGTNGHGQFITEAARIDGYTQSAAGD